VQRRGGGAVRRKTREGKSEGTWSRRAPAAAPNHVARGSSRPGCLRRVAVNVGMPCDLQPLSFPLSDWPLNRGWQCKSRLQRSRWNSSSNLEALSTNVPNGPSSEYPLLACRANQLPTPRGTGSDVQSRTHFLKSRFQRQNDVFIRTLRYRCPTTTDALPHTLSLTVLSHGTTQPAGQAHLAPTPPLADAETDRHFRAYLL
jgi:hypothetical protein